MLTFTARDAGWEAIALSILRIMTALLFMEHGTAKLLGFPPGTSTPALFSLLWLAGVIELVGGALLALGLFTRVAAFVASGEMAFAYFQAHFPQNFFPMLNRGDAAAPKVAGDHRVPVIGSLRELPPLLIG